MAKLDRGVMMLKQRQDAAEKLAKRLFAAEQAVDEAISKMAELTGYMPIARTDARLSAVVGQDALSEAAESLSALVGARRHLVATHQRLAETRDQIGLRAMAMGSGDMKPPVLASVREANLVNMVDHAA
jgi:glutamine phosphoribosylpyrophosphate amidotransferase